VTAAGVLLAAGLGRRFAGPMHKLLTPLNGKALWQWAFSNALAADFDELIIVIGDVDLVAVPSPERVTIVRNPRSASGQATSVAAAIDHATARGHDAVVVGLADQPAIPAAAWRAVAAATSPLAVATYAGRRANPVRLAASVWPLVARTGDEGARSLLRAHPEWVTEVPCAGDPIDIDTLDDLEAAALSVASHHATEPRK
jgi:molybdenum cofactor cytidylyltransferase